MNDFKLGTDTYLKSIAIRVKDRDKMIDFYKNIVGFDLKREENELAIFGTEEPSSEMLLLEESPRANDHTGEIKKLNRFSLIISTEGEMADILFRIRKAQYPIKDALEEQGRIGILLTDPEGNELEVYYGEKQENPGEPKALDQETLLEKSTQQFKKLTKDASFEKIHLHVDDLEKEHAFLSDILGLEIQDEKNGLHVLNEGDFHVGLKEAHGGTIGLPTDEVLGLDFLKFVISQENMDDLIKHLESAKKDFFVDKKKTVLTVYDEIGIEWWFVSNPKK
ncbi:glyoxalase family protein [Enterococcus faecalis 13-SD-W-01]|nr:glyoxalase family protein [Enterococcus faecalis 13-SD-W-01]